MHAHGHAGNSTSRMLEKKKTALSLILDQTHSILKVVRKLFWETFQKYISIVEVQNGFGSIAF